MTKQKSKLFYLSFSAVFLVIIGTIAFEWLSPFKQNSSITGSMTYTKSAAAAKVNAILAGNTPFLGSANAPVTIVDFADPQCEQCRLFHDYTLPMLQGYINNGTVKFATRAINLAQDPESVPSYAAANCVRKQLGDKGFYAAEDIIYREENQRGGEGGFVSYNTIDISNWIKNIKGLNYNSWQTCFAANLNNVSDLNANQAVATQYHVTELPTVFVNGVPIVGAQLYTVYAQEIQNALKKINN